MRHALDIEILSRYIDRRCSPDETGRVESHVAVCPDCAGDLNILRNSVTALGKLEALELPVDFDATFRARLDEAIRQKEARRVFVPVRVLVNAAVTVFLVLGIGLASLRYLGTVSPSVMAAKGRVEVFDKSAGVWRSAHLKWKAERGDIIKTAKAAQIDLEIPGVYSVRLKDNSELEIVSLTRRRVKSTVAFSLKRGQMLIDIQEAFKGSKFRVFTPTAETTALGTKFMIDITKEEETEKTWVGVLDGKVEVKSAYKPPRYAMATQTVVVPTGHKTEVLTGAVPLVPQRLMDNEWRKIQELYRIGYRPQVALLISTGKDRVRELLRPCPIFISDEEPLALPPELGEAMTIINEAIREKDKEKHYQAIKKLEEVVDKSTDPTYSPQFLLFIASYYNYIDMYEEAINTLQKVVDGYPDSTLASLAQCAIGVIYEDGLKDQTKAIEAYNKVLQEYPHSPEGRFVGTLDIKKVR